MQEQKKIVGLAKAFSDKRNWWAICVSTQDGDVWISPGIQATSPCPAMKGDLITATVTGPYNQVVQNTLKVESVHNIPVAPSTPVQRTGFVPKKSGNVGQKVGHAINAAFDLLGYNASIDEVITVSQKMTDFTENLRATFASQHPELSEYDIGASVGHAVRNACSIVNARGLGHKQLEAIALSILNKVAPEVTAYITAEPAQIAVETTHTSVPVLNFIAKPTELQIEVPAPVIEVVKQPEPIAAVVIAPPEIVVPVPAPVVVPEVIKEIPVAPVVIQEVTEDLPW
jgi:hypothetical protein